MTILREMEMGWPGCVCGKRSVVSLLACALPAIFSGDLVRADVYPTPSTSRSKGMKNGLYLAIRDVDDTPWTQAQWDAIAAKETTGREFFAENSGGKFDFHYTHVIDVPIELVDGPGSQRPSNWRQLVDGYVASQGITMNDYYAHTYDTSRTGWDDEQGWAGLYLGGPTMYLQYDNAGTHQHEMGHRVGVGHASSYQREEQNYVWNVVTQSYQSYSNDTAMAEQGQFRPTTFGMSHQEYGNPFDVQGHGGQYGQFHANFKNQLGWLSDSQLASPFGNDTLRLYAHDQLESVSFTDDEGLDHYGVAETYDADSAHAVRYNRTVQEFNSTLGVFQPKQQEVMLEYRPNQGGLLVYINNHLVDMTPDGGWAVPVGNVFSDILMGQSIYTGEGDFLSYDPSAPPDPFSYRPAWFEFDLLSTGNDAIGAYLDLDLSIGSGFTGVLGDVNQDDFLTVDDFAQFASTWRTDTTTMGVIDAYMHGDLDWSGESNWQDFILLRQAFQAAGLSAPSFESFQATVPEPSSQALMVSVALLGYSLRRSKITGKV